MGFWPFSIPATNPQSFDLATPVHPLVHTCSQHCTPQTKFEMFYLKKKMFPLIFASEIDIQKYVLQNTSLTLSKVLFIYQVK